MEEIEHGMIIAGHTPTIVEGEITFNNGNIAKKPSRGVFWVIDGKLIAFPFSNKTLEGVAKSGTTYNHKKLWQHVKPKRCNKPYNYYPRGRVDFTNKGIPIIYMNPNIDASYLSEIRIEFGLREEPKVKYDNSSHYLCYLDDGWTPE